VSLARAEAGTCARRQSPSLQQIVCCIYANPCCAKSPRFLAAARAAAVTLPQLHRSGNPQREGSALTTNAMLVQPLQPRRLHVAFTRTAGMAAFAVGVDCKRTPGRAPLRRDSP
jgi:hypothetical protein